MAKLYLLVCVLVLALALYAAPAAAFGAGNIASISRIEGHNWRHGDIEDLLKTVACLKHHKWTSMMIKRVYFGNWLRDYSQAVDVGTLKGVQAGTIRVLVWVLAFMSFGYATGEFEVTDERLGVYRPEEHIDNPKDYADNVDARQYDQRLRPPVSREELAVDPNTGMKNYIANESGGWATSAGYIRYSFARSIHFGRLYTHGSNKGREEDLCEALRCLGQGLHCLEDFGAHTNYTELVLRELGFRGVFPHVGVATEINLRGKRVFPLVTGTFGGVDFLHSMLGEATDHVTQSQIEDTEVGQLNAALGKASTRNTQYGGDPGMQASDLTSLLSKVPGTGALCQEAVSLQAAADAQIRVNPGAHGESATTDSSYDAYGSGNTSTQSSLTSEQSSGLGTGATISNIAYTDPQTIISKIYPILQFRDKVVRAISTVISKIPGLEDLVEKITEKVTMFVMRLLAPYIQPLIATATQSLKQGSSTVIDASGKHQYEVWTDPSCTDPTHSLLSKDHFSNVLNDPAGQIAAATLQYVAPRIIYAWDHPDVPEHEVMSDVVRVLHHPAIRDQHCEIHRNMFAAVENWVKSRADRGAGLNDLLSSESVRNGRNQGPGGHSHGGHGSAREEPLAVFAQKGDLARYANAPSDTPGYSAAAAQSPAIVAGYQDERPQQYDQDIQQGPTAYQHGLPQTTDWLAHTGPGFDQSSASQDYRHGFRPDLYQGNQEPSSHGSWDQRPPSGPPPGETRGHRPPPPGPPFGQSGYGSYRLQQGGHRYDQDPRY